MTVAELLRLAVRRRMCELLVGLPEVTLRGVADVVGEPLRAHVETREQRLTCPGCDRAAVIKDRRPVELVDLAVFGRQARLNWRKHRWTYWNDAEAC